MTHADAGTPSPEQRQALNAELLTTGNNSGFWDHNGRPAPWPEDTDEWRLSTNDPAITNPREQPF